MQGKYVRKETKIINIFNHSNKCMWRKILQAILKCI